MTRDIEPEELARAILALIDEEQGKFAHSLCVMKHLPMVSSEAAYKAFETCVKARTGAVHDDDEEVERRNVSLLAEGILCGLRIRTAIARLTADRT